MFYSYICVAAKQVAEKNSYERQIELKDQTIQNKNLKIKQLEYQLQSYQEFQQQAKVI